MSLLKKINTVKVLIIILLIAIGFTSISKGASYFTGTDNFSSTMESLNEKQKTVLALSALAGAASTAISLLPDDQGTPIAEEIADLTSYFLMILCVLMMEKYMLPVAGLFAFKILIPLGLAILIIYCIWPKNKLNLNLKMGLKIIIFSLVLAFIVPLTEYTTKIIKDTYNRVEQVEKNDEVEEFTVPTAATYEVEEETFSLSRMYADLVKKVQKTIDTTKTSVEDALKYGQTKLNELIESLAVMIVTTCIFPILIIICLYEVIKLLFKSDIKLYVKNEDEPKLEDTIKGEV